MIKVLLTLIDKPYEFRGISAFFRQKWRLLNPPKKVGTAHLRRHLRAPPTLF